MIKTAGPFFSPESLHTRETSSILGLHEAEDGMESWERRANWSGDVLERIVALLFAPANLADLAAGAPHLRRQKVLGILSHGEAEARAFLFGGVPIPADAPGEAGDAERLAVRLRALALVLCVLLGQAARFALPAATGPRTCRSLHRTSVPAVRGLGPTPPAPDT
jgi:hypothetical protein